MINARYIMVLVLTKGYWQINLIIRVQRLAVFVTNFGSYLPLIKHFRMLNAPYRFSKSMDKMLESLEEFCLPHFDAITIFSGNLGGPFAAYRKSAYEIQSRLR